MALVLNSQLSLGTKALCFARFLKHFRFKMTICCIEASILFEKQKRDRCNRGEKFHQLLEQWDRIILKLDRLLESRYSSWQVTSKAKHFRRLTQQLSDRLHSLVAALTRQDCPKKTYQRTAFVVYREGERKREELK